MAIHKKHQINPAMGLRDIRPLLERIAVGMREPVVLISLLVAGMVLVWTAPWTAEMTCIILGIYALWVRNHKVSLPLKLPKFADRIDPHNAKPGGGVGQSDVILFVGNAKESEEELWLTNSDARTHILYMGTTGAGKTEGLKSLVSNSLCWGSGFIYIDGKADTDLWASMYSLARRFGRDDDLLVLNYMTGNSDGGAPSNSLNPFASGSASYLTNLMVSLMDEAGGDNAMWKGRAISLMSSLMPALTWQRDNRGLLLDVGVVRESLNLPRIVRMARDEEIPARIRRGLNGYLRSLPGFMDEAFDDEGNAQVGPDGHAYDISIPSQQHGYLEMQFTRGLQSLGDEYGYIFSAQIADVDMLDVVLNRRILVVLIPALEKSADEAANLGKIIAASIKGMMGATLGADVEGDWEGIIENKPTRSSSPFMTVFDEVGYYTAEGMAVMAAQARSLGFSLVFAAQDLPAMEKRVKEEARSITANCNLKLFGKLEDARDQNDTKEFFERTVGTAFIGEMGQFALDDNNLTLTYRDQRTAQIAEKPKARYSELKNQREGEVHLVWTSDVWEARMFYAAPKKIKAMRVQKFLPVSPENLDVPEISTVIDDVLDRLTDESWNAAAAKAEEEPNEIIEALQFGVALGEAEEQAPLMCGALGVASLADEIARQNEADEEADEAEAQPPVAEPAPPDSGAHAEQPPTRPEPATAAATPASQAPVEPAIEVPAPAKPLSVPVAEEDDAGEEAEAIPSTPGAEPASAQAHPAPAELGGIGGGAWPARTALPASVVNIQPLSGLSTLAAAAAGRSSPVPEIATAPADWAQDLTPTAPRQPLSTASGAADGLAQAVVWVAPKRDQARDAADLPPAIAGPVASATESLSRHLFRDDAARAPEAEAAE